VRGVAVGCRDAGCALIGGEMAEHPGAMEPGEFDLVGFAVGVAERDRLIGQVRAKVANPALARFGNVRWNAMRTALCGTISIVNSSGVYSAYGGFVATSDDAVIDSDENHARFASASAEADCGS